MPLCHVCEDLDLDVPLGQQILLGSCALLVDRSASCGGCRFFRAVADVSESDDNHPDAWIYPERGVLLRKHSAERWYIHRPGRWQTEIDLCYNEKGCHSPNTQVAGAVLFSREFFVD